MTTLRAHLALLLAAAASFLPSAGHAQSALTVEQARAIVAPLYDALNRPAEKDVAKLLGDATSPEWVSCGANDVCLPRDKVIGGFKSRGAAIPDLKWEIKEILVSGNRVIVRGEGSGTPATTFLGVAPAGKSFRVMSIDVHTIENGKMVRSYHLEDWAGAVRQLGNGS
jgi:ketosteroid isomerase-like protein